MYSSEFDKPLPAEWLRNEIDRAWHSRTRRRRRACVGQLIFAKLVRRKRTVPQHDDVPFEDGISLDFLASAPEPAVDEFQIWGFIQLQLCADDAQEVARRIAIYPTWRAAWERLSHGLE